MTIAIIVLNWNGASYILDCLKSIAHLKSNHKILPIVVDNHSSDDSVELIKTKYPKLSLLQNTQNKGYAGGNNIGIKFALNIGVDWIWIVNSDVILSASSLDYLLSVDMGARTGIIGSKCLFAKGYEFHKERYSQSDLGKVIWYAGGKMDWDNVESIHIGVNEVDMGQYDNPGPTEFVTGASMLLNAQMLREVGVFDERFFLYYEENDLCRRALKSGWKLFYQPKSVVWHANAQAAGIGSPLQDYFITRNKLLFASIWASWRTKFALFRQAVRLLITGRKWQKLGVKDFFLARFGPGTYPISS